MLAICAFRGIDLEIVHFYAKGGAKVALVARSQVALHSAKAIVLAAAPTSKIITAVDNVAGGKLVKLVMELTMEELANIDMAVSNAGKIDYWDKPKFDRMLLKMHMLN